MRPWINPEIVLGTAISVASAAVDYMDHNEGFFVGIFTLLLAFSTFRLWRSTKNLWLATLESIELSKTRDSILERAYLWPGPGLSHDMGLTPTGLNRTVFFITVHNSGKTAGIITDIYYRLSTPADFEAGGKPFCHFQKEDVIVPGQPQKIIGTFVDLIGPEEKILHGRIIYTDVFKKQHVCPWKHRLYHNGGGSDPLPGCYSEWD
jgi:hypothetical protein